MSQRTLRAEVLLFWEGSMNLSLGNVVTVSQRGLQKIAEFLYDDFFGNGPNHFEGDVQWTKESRESKSSQLQ